MRLRNLSDFEFDLSRSLKVKYDNVIGLSIYAFPLLKLLLHFIILTWASMEKSYNVKYLENGGS